MRAWVRRKRWTTPGWWLGRGLAALLSVGLLVYLGRLISPAFVGWSSSSGDHDLSSEARRAGITYRDALQRPEWAAGKPVHWFITHPGPGRYYYGGDAGLPIVWQGKEPPIPEIGQNGSSRGDEVLAVVHSAGPRGVVLVYAGHP